MYDEFLMLDQLTPISELKILLHFTRISCRKLVSVPGFDTNCRFAGIRNDLSITLPDQGSE